MYVKYKIHTLKHFLSYFLNKDSNGFAESEGGQEPFSIDNFTMMQYPFLENRCFSKQRKHFLSKST